MNETNMSPVRSISRALDILQSFSIHHPTLTIDEITQATRIPKSTVYRILCTLRAQGFVELDEKDLHYKPGLKLMEFGFLLPIVLNVQKEAENLLIDLHQQTKQTVLMALNDGDQIAYTFKKEVSQGLKFTSSVGQHRPFTFGVLGPPMLAFLKDHEIERIIKKKPVSHNGPKPAFNGEGMWERIEEIRRVGLYIETDETTVGVTGIGAPILNQNGYPVAGFGVIGPTVHIEPQLEEIKPRVLEISNKVSSRIGFKGAKIINVFN